MRKGIKKAIKFILRKCSLGEEHIETKKQSFKLEKIVSLIKKGKENKIKLLFVLIFLILLCVFSKWLFVIAALVLVALSRLFQKFIPFKIGFELVTLFNACFLIAYGPVFGAIFGFFSILMTLVISEEIKRRWAFVSIISAVVVAVVAGIFPYEIYMSLAMFGFLLAALYDVIFDVIYRITLGRMDMFKRIIFYCTHVYLNYLLFLHFGQKILLYLSGM